MSQKEDMYRTVGIYTDYIDTTDFDLMPDDKDFMIKVKFPLSPVPPATCVEHGDIHAYMCSHVHVHVTSFVTCYHCSYSRVRIDV